MHGPMYILKKSCFIKATVKLWRIRPILITLLNGIKHIAHLLVRSLVQNLYPCKKESRLKYHRITESKHTVMVLRRIFGPSRDEVTGEWRGLRNEELNNLYSSPNIVRVIKSRRMRLAGHVARVGEERGCIGSWWGNPRERDHWGDLGVDGWIILGRISRRWDVGIWIWPRIGTGGGRL